MRIPARFSEHPVETFLAGGLLLLLLLVSSAEGGRVGPSVPAAGPHHAVQPHRM